MLNLPCPALLRQPQQRPQHPRPGLSRSAKVKLNTSPGLPMKTAAVETPANATHPLTRAQWRAWLNKHHMRREGVWLITYKVATGQPRVPYDDAVEEALCFGWVDSKVNKLDAERSLLWFAPRAKGTGWSAPNKGRVQKMLDAGLMQPAGLALVQAAQADGSWALLDAVEALWVPPDLAAALAALPGAAAHFEAFPRSAKRGILEWIVQAKKAETRAARIQQTATLAQHNQRANQWRGKG
jgi:uncharacterized protein YdeI (YjbR/CyaY-like superfamily)